ncbi:hypothetical protein RND71_002703 [Anisodus tanguticus]|uniref:Uncharacterized protein n=1 Tax=Anisodus tanguticus TaxID=243964 RepID=A0AAE1SUL9_9SOLA|nr:hypothetical protein RND71_002703 [Anisodus tanguticus]
MVRELRATVGSSWEGIKGVEDITNVGFWGMWLMILVCLYIISTIIFSCADGISKEKATSTHTDNYGAGCGAACGA